MLPVDKSDNIHTILLTKRCLINSVLYKSMFAQMLDTSHVAGIYSQWSGVR